MPVGSSPTITPKDWDLDEGSGCTTAGSSPVSSTNCFY